MLVLHRKEGEDILVGDNIRIRVLEIDHHFVRLGFEAPKEVPIYRTELLDRIKAEEATKTPDEKAIEEAA